MIEKIILDYLLSETGIPCYMEIPPDAPEEFIILSRTGGGERDGLEYPMITADSYAQTMLRAAVINKAVIDAMRRIPAGTDVSSCELNSAYNYTDTGEKRYRYRAVFDLVY